jgi:hypothetical protein
MSDFICDAQLCTDSNGLLGHIDAIGAELKTYSAPVGECSDDKVEIWHGLDSPAIACGKHARYSYIAVFRGHRNRIAQLESKV